MNKTREEAEKIVDEIINENNFDVYISPAKAMRLAMNKLLDALYGKPESGRLKLARETKAKWHDGLEETDPCFHFIESLIDEAIKAEETKPERCTVTNWHDADERCKLPAGHQMPHVGAVDKP